MEKIILADTLEIHIIELPKLIKQLKNNIGKEKRNELCFLNPENVGIKL